MMANALLNGGHILCWLRWPATLITHLCMSCFQDGYESAHRAVNGYYGEWIYSLARSLFVMIYTFVRFWEYLWLYHLQTDYLCKPSPSCIFLIISIWWYDVIIEQEYISRSHDMPWRTVMRIATRWVPLLHFSDVLLFEENFVLRHDLWIWLWTR